MRGALLYYCAVLGCVVVFAAVTGSAGSSNEVGSGCRRKRIMHTIRHPGCAVKKILSYACHGECPSYAQVSSSPRRDLDRVCQCCEPVTSHAVSVKLRCPSHYGRRLTVSLNIPETCMCRHCDAGLPQLGQEDILEMNEMLGDLLRIK